MTSPIGPIAPVLGPTVMTPITADIALTGDIAFAGDLALVGDLAAPQSAAGADFASKLAQGLESVQDLQKTTDDLRVQAATGSLNDVHDYMIASAESGIATSLTVAVRNKAVEAFQEIMRMQA